MSKKVIVTKEWHEKAMKALYESDKKVAELSAIVNGVNSFMLTKLTPEQQEQLEGEIKLFLQEWE